MKVTPEVEERLNVLTPSAKKVMLATLAGMCSKDIATSLGVSTDNIRHIRSRAFAKFEVKNATEFALRVLNPEFHQYLKTSIEL